LSSITNKHAEKDDEEEEEEDDAASGGDGTLLSLLFAPQSNVNSEKEEVFVDLDDLDDDVGEL